MNGEKEINVRKDIAQQIKDGRAAAKLSQKGLAALTGINHVAIARIELAQVSVGCDLLAKIARAIEKDIVIKCNI